jgi:hypothetical protein
MKQTIQERREELKSLSASAKMMVHFGSVSSINEGLCVIYAQNGHTSLKTLPDWNKEGFLVKKGEKALLLWGTPKKYNRNKEGNSQLVQDEGAEVNMNFFPICFVFSNMQVNSK